MTEPSYPAQPHQPHVGSIGLALTAVGGVLLIISFTAVDWFTRGTNEGPSHFGDIHDIVTQFSGLVAEPAKLYFGWLAWVLLAAAVVAALAANLPSPVSDAFRVVGPLVAVGGALMTFWALKIVKSADPSYTDYLKHARAGFWLAVAGFVVAGAGAAFGPRRT
jgi:hypothetical protein